jgi:psiF repeat
MKTVIIAAMLSLATVSAWADGTSCTAQATDKKLAGAAKTSFMKKCTTDATTACMATAKDKKLAGAAQTSFTKKCVSDASG